MLVSLSVSCVQCWRYSANVCVQVDMVDVLHHLLEVPRVETMVDMAAELAMAKITERLHHLR